MSDTPHLASIQVGIPRRMGGGKSANLLDTPWYSAIFKDPVEGKIRLGKTNLAGDRQADLRVHGGADKAVCAYPARHYPFWREALGAEILFGAFGENFTVAGLDEREACIGDIFAAGEATLQITQPRQPCVKLCRRHGREDMIERVHESVRVGWYFRTLAEGFVERGDELRLIERPHPNWTVELVYRLRFSPDTDRNCALALSNCRELSERWRREFKRKSGRG
ncbi:MAG: MOSC domain-containing protein [Deltaproteobacteria bacterium]